VRKVIHKYQMGLVTTHEMPKKAECICVQMQNDNICAWFLQDVDDKEIVPRKFTIYGTGHDIPIHDKYMGTVQNDGFVWHVFEVTYF